MITQLRELLLLTLLAGVFASCGSTDGESVDSGKELYLRYGCSSCHGATGVGGSLGPGLREASMHWKAESLTDFLVDPTQNYKDDERLAKLKEAYRTSMPSFSTVTREQLARIADFVLSLK